MKKQLNKTTKNFNKNKPYYIVLVILLLSMTFVSATLCKTGVPVDIREATETIIIHQQVPVMINQQVTYKVVDNALWNSAMNVYKSQLSDFNTGVTAIKPTPPTASVTTKTKTIKVQQTTTKTKYYIDWDSLSIKSKVTVVPVFTTNDITKQQIKSNYLFDDNTGLFYKGVEC